MMRKRDDRGNRWLRRPSSTGSANRPDDHRTLLDPRVPLLGVEKGDTMNRNLAKRLARMIDLVEEKISDSKERGAVKFSARDAEELAETLRNAFYNVTDASYDSLASSLVRVMRDDAAKGEEK